MAKKNLSNDEEQARLLSTHNCVPMNKELGPKHLNRAVARANGQFGKITERAPAQEMKPSEVKKAKKKKKKEEDGDLLKDFIDGEAEKKAAKAGAVDEDLKEDEDEDEEDGDDAGDEEGKEEEEGEPDEEE